MKMYHSTLKVNDQATNIAREGLKVGGHGIGFTMGGSWAKGIYGTQPIYLSMKPSFGGGREYEGDVLEVDVSGLELISDLPSVVDYGAYVEENEGVYWEYGEVPPVMETVVDGDGFVSFEDLLTFNSPASQAAINLTGTAVSLTDISPDRIRLVTNEVILRGLVQSILSESKDPDDVMDILITDFFESRHFDDTMDAVFKHLAPKLVRHVLENEINEDMAEFTDGAIEGRWEKQHDWAGEDPSPKDAGYPEDSLDYKLGYRWGWANADTWEGDKLPDSARKAAVETQIKEFEDEISEEMIIAAFQAANKKINPWELLKQAGQAVSSAYSQAGGGPKGLKAAIKKGLPVALSILVGEALDNVIIPMTFFSLTGIPIPPLPVGVGEIINPIVISMVGAEEVQEELADELGWYEKEYGPTTAFGPAVAEEGALREYVRMLLTEVAKGPQDLPADIGVTILKMGGPVISFFYASIDDPENDNVLPSGGIDIMPTENPPRRGRGSCGGAWKVNAVETDSGWGPMLYDIAMEYATLNGGGLFADRGSVSEPARKVWDYYLDARSDVTAHQLDDLKNTLTPEEEDNCNQRVSAWNSDAIDLEDIETDWKTSALSKRYTKEPTTINALRADGKLMDLT